MEAEILNTQILHQSGSYCRIRRWLKGIHPERGQITMGWTGWETVEEKDVIIPICQFSIIS